MTSAFNAGISQQSNGTVVARRVLTGLLRWRDNVTVTADGADLILLNGGRTTRLRNIPEPVRRHLAGLDPPDAQSEHVRAHAQQVLARFAQLTATSLRHDTHELMRHESTAQNAIYETFPLTATDRIRLDRFALLRNRGQYLVFECSRSMHRFILTSELAHSLAAGLGTPRLVGEIAEGTDSSDSVTKELLEHWVGAGLVERASPDGTFPTDTNPALEQWEFHDLLMHNRSRGGRYDEPWGALSPYRERIEALPAVVAPRSEPTAVVDLPLPAPWISSLSLSEAVDQRRSIRNYGDDPITLEQLAAFLHRAFRDRARFDPPFNSGQESKVSRPYPSGGGLYEHELYLTVRRCTGLEPGIYHYDALGHRLELITRDPDAADEMLAFAAAATGAVDSPDILITLTARFQRMSWRYRSIAYANTLRTTGAIYQTMYLVATDLDLAPCALGNGDADLSARALGLDYLQESSVGDFILGRRNPSDSVEGAPMAGWTVLDNPSET